jgi:hypothetical protein
MNTTTIDSDRKVFGFQVKNFPDKIGEAFDELMNKLPDGKQRTYYGVSWMEGNDVIYYTAVEQKSEGEAETFGAKKFTIGKGEYLAETIPDWMPKVGSIKDVFGKMMSDPRTDLTKPCIEWYKSDKEMICLMKLK